MKERLIIISDLWGREKSLWLSNYTNVLEAKFDLKYYDSCELGEVDKAEYREDKLHSQFVNGGIEIAVENLIRLEKNPVKILAFSVGGVIAWKFGLQTKTIKSLICVSSTRLRKETLRPKGEIELYFGESDEYRPTLDWSEPMEIELNIIPNKGHEVYSEAEFAKRLSEHLLS